MNRWLLRIGQGLLTIAVLWALVAAADPSALVTSLRQARSEWILIAVGLLPLNLAIEAWVWKRLLESVVDRVPPAELIGAVLSGFTLGLWTPVQIGEYAGRALYFSRGDRWTVSLSVFAQRMVDMLIGVGLGLFVLLWTLWRGLLPTTTAWLAASGIGVATLTLLLIFVSNPHRVHGLAQRLLPTQSWLTKRTALFARLSAPQLRSIVGGSVLRYLTFTGQFVCLAYAFGTAGSVGLLATAVALTFYAKYLLPSLTMFDLGIREGSAVFFFQTLGLGAAAGLNAALLLFAVNLLIPALLGLPFLLTLNLSDRAPEPAAAPRTSCLRPES